MNMISKMLLITLSMLALGACSSTKDMEEESTESLSTIEQVAEDKTVQTDMIEVVEPLTEEELMVQQYGIDILKTTIQFDFDKSTIKPEFEPVLLAHATYLVDHPQKILTIEGHADEKGTPEYNISLGERRAKVVAAYLENNGVVSGQISVVSYGEEKPINTGNNESAWSQNRRAELVY